MYKPLFAIVKADLAKVHIHIGGDSHIRPYEIVSNECNIYFKQLDDSWNKQ